MTRLKHLWYNRVPVAVRRPIVLIIGSLLIIASALTGWLPGPGGIPLFLIGIAVLATEFERAKQFRDWILGYIEQFGVWFKKHKIIGTIMLISGVCIGVTIGIISFQKFR